MTAADLRLGALLAAFAPTRARALASRLAAPAAPELAARAARLADVPRRERLAAVAAALAPDRSPPRGGERRTGRDAAGERPRLAALLDAARAGGPPLPIAPALARLLRDRASARPPG